MDSLREVGEMLRSTVGGSAASQVVLVTDETVGATYAHRLTESLAGAGFAPEVISLRPGEGSKRLSEAERLYRLLAGERFGRDGVMVALGGGVVSDLAGFVAGTWMRGVRWAICPTTLEADIDAAIGGKTAVNVPGGKNLVGVFHPPTFVLIDPTCLATLPRRELVAGLAESVKHALIASEDFLHWHEENVEKILALHDDTIVALIEKNVAIKSSIVARDPRETTGERFVLNFGHTVGHAIEECSMNPVTAETAEAPTTAHGAVPHPRGEGERLRHGECVAIGMAAACRLSQRLGLLDEHVVERVTALLERCGLPTRIPPDADHLLEVMRVDKKVRGQKVRFVLLEGVSRPIVRDDIAEETIREVLGSQ